MIQLWVMAQNNWLKYLFFTVLTCLLIVTSILLYRTYEQNEVLSKSLVAEKNNRQAVENQLAKAEDRIANMDNTLRDVRDALEDEEDKNDRFQDQIDAISGTVDDLDKLSKTDEELLQKYSKVYFLNEHYEPSDLSQIDKDYVYNDGELYFLHDDVMEYLEDMLDEAEDDGVDISVTSAYRSFTKQSQLKGQYTQTYGSGANAFSADQGYSEHQLGTTVDFTTNSLNGSLQGFASTEAYEWLQDNAHEYGFTLSYPENNQYYVFEPWHWRFVGEDLAEDLHDDKAHFYDWDQRKLDEYLISIFD